VSAAVGWLLHPQGEFVDSAEAVIILASLGGVLNGAITGMTLVKILLPKSLN
jgi:hypothetical protein